MGEFRLDWNVLLVLIKLSINSVAMSTSPQIALINEVASSFK